MRLTTWLACAAAIVLMTAPAGAQTVAGDGSAFQRTANDVASGVNGSSVTSTDQGDQGAQSDNGTNVQTPRLRQSPQSRGYVIGSQGDEPVAPPVYVPGEFENYVQTLVTTPNLVVRRFGANLVTDTAARQADQDPLPAVSADYVVKPGDEISLTLWGGVDADLQLRVDRAGRIAVPRVGSIAVAGVRYGDLNDVLVHRVGQVFRNFQLSASMGRLRAVRVFVTGYAQRPGSLTVSSLSSVLHVLMRAGGPAAAGSFRDIELKRGGKVVAHFDLYDLLLNGDRTTDQTVQPDDVVHIGPIGTQVALLGSVNQPAIFELRPGENIGDLIRMAGGFSAVADRSHVIIERLADRPTARVTDIPWTPANVRSTIPGTGDVVRVFSAVTVQIPRERQNKRVRVEGEVARPGEYVLPPGSRMSDALAAAGGLTPAAYVYATVFTRESERLQQQENFDRALRDLETTIAKASANSRVTTVDEATASNANATSNARLIDRLRQASPTGRIVLELTPDSKNLPDLALEDGDRLLIPPRSNSVGVFGSVFNAGTFVLAPNRSIDQYLRMAGGPTAGADNDSIFLIRANGSVISARQGASFWSSRNDLLSADALPGDTVFVPEQINKSTFVQNAKDWTQILYQFGIGIAAINSLK